MEIRFSQSARKHRIGKQRALFVMANVEPVEVFAGEGKTMKKESATYTVGPNVNLDKEVVLDSNGRRITEARARQIARETHQIIVGRPSLSSPDVHSPEIKARVPMKLKKSLQREGKRRGQTSSELVRRAIEEFLRSA